MSMNGHLIPFIACWDLYKYWEPLCGLWFLNCLRTFFVLLQRAPALYCVLLISVEKDTRLKWPYVFHLIILISTFVLNFKCLWDLMLSWVAFVTLTFILPDSTFWASNRSPPGQWWLSKVVFKNHRGTFKFIPFFLLLQEANCSRPPFLLYH